MKNKLVFATGLAVGYVLGTRSGRERYEKLRTKAKELWQNPKVQETVSEAAGTIKDKAPALQEQAAEALRKAQGTVSTALHKDDAGKKGSDELAGPAVPAPVPAVSTDTGAAGTPGAAATLPPNESLDRTPGPASITDGSPEAEQARLIHEEDLRNEENDGD